MTLGERPLAGAAPGRDETEGSPGDRIEWMGTEVQDLTPSLRSTYGIPDAVAGVWVTSVATDSPLFEENIRDSDVIAEVNGTAVETVRELEAAVAAVPSGSLLRFYVTRFDRSSGNSASFFAVVQVP